MWNFIFIGWNAFLVCFYLNVGVLDRVSGRGHMISFECKLHCVTAFHSFLGKRLIKFRNRQLFVVPGKWLRLQGYLFGQHHIRWPLSASPTRDGRELPNRLFPRWSYPIRCAVSLGGKLRCYNYYVDAEELNKIFLLLFTSNYLNCCQCTDKYCLSYYRSWELLLL